jgi:hypothetical protein
MLVKKISLGLSVIVGSSMRKEGASKKFGCRLDKVKFPEYFLGRVVKDLGTTFLRRASFLCSMFFWC